MQVQVLSKKDSKQIEVKDSIFGIEFNNDLVHQVVTAYMAGSRAGTKAQKSRSDVSGGGAKPWRQKGTGRARAGTIRSPIWRSGGVTFAARPRNYSQKVNKKVYRKAISCILSQLLREEHLKVVDNFELTSNKTRDFVVFLKENNLPEKDLLIVTNTITENIDLASRNIPTVEVINTREINPYTLLKYSNVVILEDAIKDLEELYS
jgi:large subunit ribosomal protein L4